MLDAKRLAGHALGFSDLELATRENEPADPQAELRLAAMMARRLGGESVARIIGEREFYGLGFSLNPSTLEPRPETELLVDLAIAALPQGGSLLDLGTGTGCIPIAVLANRSDVQGIGVDLSEQALEAARANAVRHQVEDRLAFLLGSWFGPLFTSPFGGEVDPLSGRVRGSGSGTCAEDPISPSYDFSRQSTGEERFDLITSNPPYIASDVIPTLAPEVRMFDPSLALDGGPDGLAPYRVIVKEAPRHLVPGAQLLLEIGHDQGAAVSELLTQGGFHAVEIHRDLNGLDRVVSAHHM